MADVRLWQLTSGFPKEPTPLFKAPTASAFPTENRQGLHDQSLNVIFPKLNAIIQKLPQTSLDEDGFEFSTGPPSSDKGKGKASHSEAYEELATFLSDWHLLAFLDTCGIFDASDVKLLARIASKRETSDVEKLLKTHSWRTLVTIAQEHSGKWP